MRYHSFVRGMVSGGPVAALLAFVVCAGSGGDLLAAEKTLAPLPAGAAAAFRAIPADPPPERLTLDAHFLVSDEKAHHVFQRHIEGAGGVFVGLGTDQNYLMAGWARPEVLVLLDFDELVVDLHDVYRALFLAAPTPEAFAKLWKEEASDGVAEAIRAAEPEPARAKYLHTVWRRSRRLVNRRLRVLRRIQREAGVSWFLTDAAQYDWIRRLFQTDRVFAVRGDLTKGAALAGVGAAARKAGLPVRVLYLSNAERYFRYNDAFEAATLALPFDERSRVVRTGGKSSLGYDPADGHYRYFVQSGPDFRAWFENRRRPRNVYVVLRRCEPDDRWEGLYVAGPPREKKKRAKKKRGKKK